MDIETATNIARGSLEIGSYSVFASGAVKQLYGWVPSISAGRYVGYVENAPRGGLVFDDQYEFTGKDAADKALEFCISRNIKAQAAA